VLAVLNSDEFVDKPPLQVYAILLERGQYLCSVSTMYRVLHENQQVKERRAAARSSGRAPSCLPCGTSGRCPGIATLGVRRS